VGLVIYVVCWNASCNLYLRAMGGFTSSLVDEVLDENERFQSFIMISYDNEAVLVDAQQRLPLERCLKALVGVYELLAAVLPPAGRRIVTRPPEQQDLDAELSQEATAPLDYDSYEELARAVFRRIAVDRGRRVTTGLLVGTACVLALKSTLRRTPLVGSLLHALLMPLLPATVVSGPALGLLLCAYLPPHYLSGRRRARKGKEKRALTGREEAPGETS